jgi:hypothetical protein
LRGEILELKERNIALESELQELKSKTTLENELTFDNLVYWRIKGSEKEGPFCQPCFDRDKRLSRLRVRSESFYCGVCKTRVDKPGHERGVGASW